MSDFFPTVSVIVPVYNGAHTLDACLESLLRLNYPGERFEIIVVENFSRDDSVAVASRYPARLLISQKRGPAAARNLGVEASQAEIIAFTDADCVADPNWLLNLVLPYQEESVGATGGDILAYRQEQPDELDHFFEKFPPLVNFLSGPNEFFPHLFTANASYRREALRAMGGFNPALITGEDVDLSWRLQLQTRWDVAYTPFAIVYHRHRKTIAGLCRQYRQYGFGEIVLDTLFGRCPGYPRRRFFQLKRVFRQILQLPIYLAAVPVRRARYHLGQISRIEAQFPRFGFLVEYSNILGKLEAIIATRLMTDPRPALNKNADVQIRKFY